MLVPGCAILGWTSAEHAGPGQRPRRLFEDMFRLVRAEDSCAHAGRTDRFRNPGRCPGLECGGAFSAGIKVVQIRIHEPSWLTVFEMALKESPSGLFQVSLPAIQYSVGANRGPEGPRAFARHRGI